MNNNDILVATLHAKHPCQARNGGKGVVLSERILYLHRPTGRRATLKIPLGIYNIPALQKIRIDGKDTFRKMIEADQLQRALTESGHLWLQGRD